MFHKIIAYISLGLFLLSSFFLGGCHYRNIPDGFAGKWEHNGHVYEYKPNGKLYYDDTEMKYEIIEDGKLHVYKNGKNSRNMIFEYNFNPDGTLTINGINYYPAD